MPATRARGPRLAGQASLTLYAAWLCGPAIIAFLRVTASRLREPYALWWLEPLFFRAALAWHQGTPLYGPPNLDYTPGIYNPGMAVVGGTLLGVFGAELPSIRLFSYTCLLALAALVAWWSGSAARSPAVGLAAFALVLSTVTTMGTPVTVTNVDAPCTLFCVLACWLVARREQVPTWQIAASAACVVTAFAFKQPAFVIGAALAFALLLRDRKQALVFVAVAVGVAGLLVAVLLLASSGWYWTYAVEIPMKSRRIPQPNFASMLYSIHPVATVSLGAAPLLLTLLAPRPLRWVWLPLSAAFVCMGYLGVSKAGGGSNTLLPLLVGGVLLYSLLPQLAGATSKLATLRGAVVIELVAAALVVHLGGTLAAKQLNGFAEHAAGLWRRVPRGRPTSEALVPYASFDRRVRKKIALLPPPVFVGARFFGTGALLNTHQTPIFEGNVRTNLFDMDAILNGPLSTHRYGAMIVWEYSQDTKFRERLERWYTRKERFGVDPLSGVHVSVWLPKR